MLDWLLGNTAYTVPGTLYVGLFTSAPTPSTSGTEVAGGSYARVAVTNNTTNFPNASNKTKSNGTAITFAQATALWGTVVAVGIFDAVSGGNLLLYATLTTSRTINNGDTASFAIGQLIFNAA